MIECAVATFQVECQPFYSVFCLNSQRSLKSKHPPGQGMHPNSIIQGVPQDVHPIIFDCIGASLYLSVSVITCTTCTIATVPDLGSQGTSWGKGSSAVDLHCNRNEDTRSCMPDSSATSLSHISHLLW